jgi:predicted DNA-binding antitoxin AbrB/MazE fold protein
MSLKRRNNLKFGLCHRSRPDPEGDTLTSVRPVEALYENGILRPAKPLNLRSGERVGVIVVRQPDSKRWDLARLASKEDADLVSAGLDDWAAALERDAVGRFEPN